MRFASMLSGGKDSCLAHHVACQWGWEATAGIVIRPRDPESHMFHVPNIDVAVAQAQAMGLDPLEVEAPAGEGIELSALVEAFERARDEHAVDTIVSGAVASEYQRTRIEAACHEVGLKSHTPIWHKDPWAIVDTLIDGGYDVRFSAVAAWGLDEAWLGRRLDAQAREELAELEARYRIHPGGEGGEYETLVLDGPPFERAIEVTGSETAWDRDNGRWQVTGFELTGPRA